MREKKERQVKAPRQKKPHVKTTPKRLEELRAMSYANYLKTPEWYRRRAVVLRYAGQRCQICNNSGLLNVHHRTYTRDGVSIIGEEKLSDLVALCRSCHEIFHQNGKLAKL